MKSDKVIEILAINSQIQELKILFAKQSKNDGGNNNNSSENSSKTIAPKSGKSWTKEKKTHTRHWCKWHGYWTATHNSATFRAHNDNATDKSTTNDSSNKKTLKINLASLENDNMIDDIFGMVASVKTNHHVATDEFEGIFDANVSGCSEIKKSPH